MKTVQINGLDLTGWNSYDEIVNYALAKSCILVAINSEKIFHANEETREIINANVSYPDGIGAVYALRKKGVDQRFRIPGCDLWLEIIKRNYRSKSFYFIGGTTEVINKTVQKLRTDFVSINIVGYHNGYLNQQNKDDLVADVVLKKPDIVFVAQGSPRQELFMMELSLKHKALYQGLGGSFDLYVGKVSPTPLWIQNIGFHWLYRAIQEPKRIRRHGALLMFLLNLIFNPKY